MFPHTPDPVWTVGLGAAVALTLAIGRAPASHAGSQSDTPQVEATRQDTARVGDRRCLTRRAEDCLAEPVPFDEPHEAVCAVCHDLWEVRRPAQTARACSGGGCHGDPASASPFHGTVSAAVLGQCTACHKPHDFRVSGGAATCGTCHVTGGSTVTSEGDESSRRLPAGLHFVHGDHGTVACGTCHGENALHGSVRVQGREDCRSCHHTAPLVSGCTGCHVVEEVRETSFEVTKRLEITIGSLDRPIRTVVFRHSDHWQHTGCAVCHTGGIDLETAKGADCSGCHLEHHEPTAHCVTCHEVPAPGAHDRSAHLGCGGAGCHDRAPAGIRSAPRTRELCLACHQDLVDHKAGRTCVDCHVLPPSM